MGTDLRRRRVATALAGTVAAMLAGTIPRGPAHADPSLAGGPPGDPGGVSGSGPHHPHGAGGPVGPGGSADREPGLLGAWEADEVRYVGALSSDIPLRGAVLPFRPHQIVRDPLREASALVVARRPGDYLARIDWRAARLEFLAECDPERAFEGHAAFSADGRILYSAESDTRSGAGLIGVRAAGSLDKTAEWVLPGIGPHAVLRGAERSLWVALGGLLTLPETGRTKRNVDRMAPALLRLSADDGRLLGQWRLQDPRLGIRHLALSSGGTVGVAIQSEHDDDSVRARAPVFAVLSGDALIAGEVPPDAVTGGYGADIACIERGGHSLFAVSCPRAGCVGLWDAGGRWQGSIALTNARALAADGGVLIAASDDGRFVRSAGGAAGFEERRETGLRWDNHMVLLPNAR